MNAFRFRPLLPALLPLLLASFAAPCFADSDSSAPALTASTAPRRPNIILILADDLGYGDLGCYGQKEIQTPNLDKLAAEGTRFTAFYSGAALGAPSRAALLTGLHTGHGRIRGNGPAACLTSTDVTLASILKASGYRTGLIGKWGLGGRGTQGAPWLQGFFEFVGCLDEVRAQDYFAPSVDRYDGNSGYEGPVAFPANEEDKRGVYLPDIYTTAAVNFISINKPDQFNRYRPFFLCVVYPLPAANTDRQGNGMEVPNDEPYGSKPWPQPEKNKAAMITRLDADIGRILDKLRETGQETNTVILFTSDNGPHSEGGVQAKFLHSAGAFRGIKRDLYEGGIRVPLIARWPTAIPAGRVSSEPWASWDILPTIEGIASATATTNIDGISYLSELTGAAQTNRHEFFYWESHEDGFQQAVRMGDWKAVRPQAKLPLELYNLAKDPGESTNVAAANPQIVARIEKYLKTARTDSPAWPVSRSYRKPEAPPATTKSPAKP
jgi:arylsulfatase A-like enzyme